MSDRELLLERLERLAIVLDELMPQCAELVRDTIVLLKEQDPVKPHYNARTNWYECGACHYSMTSGMHCRGELIPAYKANYCAKCGKGVMWND